MSDQAGSAAHDPRLIETLRRYFGARDAEAVDSVLDQLETVLLPGGEWLFRTGDPGASLYLIQRGRLQVWRDGEGDVPDLAPEALLGEMGPGEVVGEVSLLTGGDRSAGVRAIRDTRLLRMDRPAFERLAAAHPSLAIEMAAQIATRLRDRTAARPVDHRGPSNIVILPLDEGVDVQRLGRALTACLEPLGDVACLDHTAPEAGSTSLGDWLDEQEERHRYLVLEARRGGDAWSQTCLRHADLVLLVGDADRPPSSLAWEEATAHGSLAARRVLVLLHPSGRVAHGARWRAVLEPDALHHVRADRYETDTQRLARILTGRAVGLVLGGGAARGFAHVGVYRALREADVPIDWVGGTSIGSVFAATVGLDWTPEQTEALARTAFVQENPLGDYTLPLVALLRGRRVQRLVQEYFDEDIEDLPIPYFCVSSHLERGEIQVHERGKLWRAIRASVALPGVLPPAVVGGELSIDGGVLNNLPVDVMRARGVGKVIAVDLSLREDSLLRFDEVPGPLEILRGRVLPSRRGEAVPSILSLLVKASMGASAAHTRAMREQADLLLQPPVGPYGLLDVRAFDDLVALGYRYAKERLAGWKPLAAVR